MVGHKNEHARRYLRYVSTHTGCASFSHPIHPVWDHITACFSYVQFHIAYCVSPVVKPPRWRGHMVLHGLHMAIRLRWRASMTKPWLPTSLLLSWWKGRRRLLNSDLIQIQARDTFGLSHPGVTYRCSTSAWSTAWPTTPSWPNVSSARLLVSLQRTRLSYTRWRWSPFKTESESYSHKHTHNNTNSSSLTLA